MTTYQPGERVTIYGPYGPEGHGVVLDTPGVMPGRTPVRRDDDTTHTITLVLDENLTPETTS